MNFEPLQFSQFHSFHQENQLKINHFVFSWIPHLWPGGAGEQGTEARQGAAQAGQGDPHTEAVQVQDCSPGDPAQAVQVQHAEAGSGVPHA